MADGEIVRGELDHGCLQLAPACVPGRDEPWAELMLGLRRLYGVSIGLGAPKFSTGR
ncbi:hypothetical protein CT19431_140056 [Cupriavidus taiwanensis]|nr:hypothetical protein CT19431_140056 [Cupriavidus taiwanensis]